MSRPAFDLWMGPLRTGELTVASFRGHEGVSALYRFDVVFQTEIDVLTSSPSRLGEPAALILHVEEESTPRVISGITAALTGMGRTTRGLRAYRARLAPRMWLLKKRKTTRIFQDLSPIDIIDSVLNEHGIARVFSLMKGYRKREYCVQYRETDYDFVARLCAEAGIFFYFVNFPMKLLEAELPSEHVVFCDDAQRYPPMAAQGINPSDSLSDTVVRGSPALHFRPFGGSAMAGREAVHELTYRRAIRPKSVALRDYDFERPLLNVNASAELGDRGGQPDVPAAELATVHSKLEIYEHHGDYGQIDVSNDHAETHLSQHRARAILARGQSSCRRLTPGHRFRLEGHPEPAFDGEYTPVRIEHEGHDAVEGEPKSEKRYQNRFECVPALIAYRPKRPKRDLSQVLESAVVVGPNGQEIYTDGYGRIKVQFHWDRDGKNDEHSSCWMRVMQPWGGSSWGAQFIPRIGMEVLVSFLGGDEDRPVVMGSVYNATHPPPFVLPLSKTQSGIRTHSVGGEGSNELLFEDAAGAEVLSLRAQRDLSELALRNHSVTVGGAQAVEVAGSQRVNVGGERLDRVGGPETRSVAGEQVVAIEGEQKIQIAGKKTEIVKESSISSVNGATFHNRGSHSETIDGYATTTVGDEEKPTGLAVMVYGSASHDASNVLSLRSDTRLVFSCGESHVAITRDTVRIDANTIVIKAKEKLILLGDGPGIELAREAEVLADTIKLFSKGGSVELDSEAAHVDGPLVKLNCGAGKAPEIEDEEEKPKTKRFRWRCLDADQEPYKNKYYSLMTQGFKTRGNTDGDGVVEEEVPEEAFSAVLTLWTESFPEGERVTYTIRFGDLPPSSTAYGAQIRLKNLGYYMGPETDEVTPELTGAILRFQYEHGLPTSGEPDGATADKLDEIHP
jgi:type VI secretion system secreted protein VgrG